MSDRQMWRCVPALPVALACISCQAPQSSASKAKPDPLLGKWVCLANNADKFPNQTLEFRADGTAIMRYEKNKPVTMLYRREPGVAFMMRRRPPPSSKADVDALLASPWNRAGVEAVYFGDKKSGFTDWGGWLLMLDPKEQILMNPLTFLWCRAGDEARVRKMAGLESPPKE